jgi:Uma2 family endonuclease
MGLHEITLPTTEPETEWVRGRALQKVSPTRSHALLQRALGTALHSWAGERGEVGTEWRFRIAPPGKALRPLVPDVSFVAVERLRGLSGEDLEIPRLSPDVAVEILSPGDRRPDLDDKIETYLAAGSRLVIIVDPQTRTIELHDGLAVATVRAGEVLAHPVLPGFALPVAELFATIAPPK